MHRALDDLANNLLLASTGANLASTRGHCFVSQDPLVISFPQDRPCGRLWEPLEAPRLGVVLGTAPQAFPHDIVVEDVIPFKKRVSMTVCLWQARPMIRIHIDAETTNRRAGPYGAAYELHYLDALPRWFQPPGRRDATFGRWLRSFLMAFCPGRREDFVRDGELAPTGIPFVDDRWPDDQVLAENFSLATLCVTTFFDPQTSAGHLESLVLSFASLTSPPPLPAGEGFPDGVFHSGYVFQKTSPGDLAVRLRFGADLALAVAEIDGAVVLGESKLPLQWTSFEPDLFSGDFDASASGSPPFFVGHIAETLGRYAAVLTNMENIPLHQATLTCDLEGGSCEFRGQCADVVRVGGIECTDLLLTIRWGLDDDGQPLLAKILCDGTAMLGEPTDFRAVMVLKDVCIAVLESDYSSQSWRQDIPIAQLVAALPRYLHPQRQVHEGAGQPQLLQLDEQERGIEEDFDELVEDEDM